MAERQCDQLLCAAGAGEGGFGGNSLSLFRFVLLQEAVDERFFVCESLDEASRPLLAESRHHPDQHGECSSEDRVEL